MDARVLAVAGGAAGLAAWYATRRPASNEIDFTALRLPGESVFDQAIDFLGVFGMVRVSAMGNVTSDVMAQRNVLAMLAVIRRGEGTQGRDGYQTMFGGKLFMGFADHPRVNVCRTFSNGKRVCSTAAGAYQFLASTWDETRAAMKLPDFSPASQDRAAVGRIAARGALSDVIAGRFDAAILKLSREWASLPGSPYGQPVISKETARSVFLAAGGLIPGVVLA